MRIISRFHDYYDTVMAHGYDDKVTYVRKTEEMPKPPTYLLGKYTRWHNQWPHPFHRHVVVVCGKPFFGISPMGTGTYESRLVSKQPLKYVTVNQPMVCWDYDALRKAAMTSCNKDRANTFNMTNPRPLFLQDEKDLYGSSRKFLLKERKALRDWFKLNEDPGVVKDQVHFDNGSPLLYVTTEREFPKGKSLHCMNPCLRDFSFQKVMDPYTAFQEIEMYIGGVMGGHAPPMVEIKNETRIHKAGFDKWSFRKMPTKRKAK